MFNWEKFKSGKLSVILRTKELAEDFYKKCNERGIDWNGNIDYAIWREGGVKYTYDTLFNMLVWGDIDKDKIIEYLEWRGSNKMQEKTFREVIADIKDGEVWESVRSCFQLEEISCLEEIIRFKFKGVFVDKTDRGDNVDTGIGNRQTFKLKRKEYTFEEAFKAYEEGKEIESDYSGCRYKKENGKDTFIFLADWSEFDHIELQEIRGKWYIND